MENVKLNFIILCDNAFFAEPDKKLNIMGSFDTINSSGFPAIHPRMSVVISVDNIEQGNHIEILKITKDNLEIINTKTNFSKSESGRHQFIHNLLNVKFPQEGKYNVEVFIDDQFIGSTAMNTKKNI